VLFALGCGGSDTGSGSSGGCGSGDTTGRCDIVAEGTACGDRITLECIDGAKPESDGQCEEALVEGDTSIYCCTSAAQEGQAASTAEGGSTSGATGGGTTVGASSASSETGAGAGGSGGAGEEPGEGGGGSEGA
jgi:hypothetical protein